MRGRPGACRVTERQRAIADVAEVADSGHTGSRLLPQRLVDDVVDRIGIERPGALQASGAESETRCTCASNNPGSIVPSNVASGQSAGTSYPTDSTPLMTPSSTMTVAPPGMNRSPLNAAGALRARMAHHGATQFIPLETVLPQTSAPARSARFCLRSFRCADRRPE